LDPKYYSKQFDIEELILRARRQCPVSINTLLEIYQPMLLQIARDDLKPMLNGKVGASDLVQDTCIEIAKSIDQFRGSNAKQFTSWLIEILRNNIANNWRFYTALKRDIRREAQPTGDSSGNKQRQVASLADREPSPSKLVMEEESYVLIDKALATLSELEQRVIMMRNRDRKTFSEIGAAIQRSDEAARKIWLRAVESLQLQLNTGDAPNHDR
jgi:RNA polymerase sigma-70 factor (ECF subfamily)